MNIIAEEGSNIVLNFERGEELVSGLLNFCKEKNIAGGTLTGLGAADELEVAYYNLSSKSYERHRIHEEVEILSLVGNIGTLKNEKVLHVHGVFGRKDLSTFGGHVFSLRVSGACEIHLTILSSTLNRSFNEATGLNLLCSMRDKGVK